MQERARIAFATCHILYSLQAEPKQGSERSIDGQHAHTVDAIATVASTLAELNAQPGDGHIAPSKCSATTYPLAIEAIARAGLA